MLLLEFPGRLTPDMLERAAHPVDVVLDDATWKRVATCREFVFRSLDTGQPVYGATTGFGPLVGFAGRADTADQCENTLNHLTTGHGGELSPAIARAAFLARLWSLAQGRSGVSVSVVDALLTPGVCRKVRCDLRKLLVGQPELAHWLLPHPEEITGTPAKPN